MCKYAEIISIAFSSSLAHVFPCISIQCWCSQWSAWFSRNYLITLAYNTALNYRFYKNHVCVCLWMWVYVCINAYAPSCWPKAPLSASGFPFSYPRRPKDRHHIAYRYIVSVSKTNRNAANQLQRRNTYDTRSIVCVCVCLRWSWGHTKSRMFKSIDICE